MDTKPIYIKRTAEITCRYIFGVLFNIRKTATKNEERKQISFYCFDMLKQATSFVIEEGSGAKKEKKRNSQCISNISMSKYNAFIYCVSILIFFFFLIFQLINPSYDTRLLSIFEFGLLFDLAPKIQ